MRWMLGGLLALQAMGANAQGLSDSDRARRDAEKVFSFIKIQTVKKTEAKPEPKPDAPKPMRSAPARPADVQLAQAEPARAEPTRVLSGDAGASVATQTQAVDASTVVALAAPSQLAPVLPASAPLVAEEEDEVGELKLIDFVAPELTPQVAATLGATNPRVKLHFKVGADGRVSGVRAAEGVPRRIAQLAERAVAQWRFDTLPAPRDAEVEIAFRRD